MKALVTGCDGLIGSHLTESLLAGADTTRAAQGRGFTPATAFGDGLLAEFEWVASVAGRSRSGR